MINTLSLQLSLVDCVFLLLLVLCAWAVFILKQLAVSTKDYNPPIVFHWFPIIGSALAFGNDPLRFLIENRKKHGDIFTFTFFGKKITAALGPHGQNFVFGGNPEIFNAEDVYTNITTPIVGKGVAYDVPSHVFGEQKKFLKMGLTNESFRHYVGLIEEEVENYLDTSHNFHQSGPHDTNADQLSSFDPLRILEDVAILTSSRTLQGPEVRSSIDETVAALYKDLDASVILVNFLLPNLPLPVNRRRDRAQKYMSKFYLDIIRKRKLSATKEDADNTDLISSLLRQTYKDGRALEDHEIAHLMIGLLMASQHTSATSGAWILLHLAENPRIADALYAEQLKAFASADRSLRSMTYDELKNLPLMTAVIRETLRIHPPIHNIMRHVRKEVLVPPDVSANMYRIPAGQYMLVSPLASHMDGQMWEDPTNWDPFRWIDSAKQEENSAVEKGATDSSRRFTGTAFQPFGSGKHKCIGEQFAYLQLGTIIATIIRRFNLRTIAGVPKPNYQTLVPTPKEPRMIYYGRR